MEAIVLGVTVSIGASIVKVIAGVELLVQLHNPRQVARPRLAILHRAPISLHFIEDIAPMRRAKEGPVMRVTDMAHSG